MITSYFLRGFRDCLKGKKKNPFIVAEHQQDWRLGWYECSAALGDCGGLICALLKYRLRKRNASIS